MTSTDLPHADRRRPVNRALWAASLVLLATLAGGTLYRVWPLLYPEVRAMAPLDPACDLRAGPCSSRFPDGGTVRFSLEPRTLPPVAPLRIAVDLEELSAELVELDFAGTDMNMGFNRVQLAQVGPGRYEGQGMLPVCVRNRMGWEAKVLVHTSSGLLVAPFRFETVSRP